MTGYDEILGHIADLVAAAADVPFCHAPAVSAGEKIIYRCSPGKYDGEWERFVISMRFISTSMDTALARAKSVSRILCAPGDRSVWEKNGCQNFVVREEGGGSGYIGRTGHFFVLARFEVKRRLPSTLKEGEGAV